MRDRVLSVFPGPGIAADPEGDGAGWVGPPAAPRPDELVRAAVLVPLIDRAEGMTVLLTRRTAHLNAHAGQIAFPGGREQAGDDSPEHTALRETHEEIGLPPDRVELVGRLNVRVTGTGYQVVPVVGLIVPPFVLKPDPGEVALVFEVPLAHVMDRRNHRVETRIDKGVEREFLAVPFGDHHIWGLTARLLINLSERLRDG